MVAKQHNGQKLLYSWTKQWFNCNGFIGLNPGVYINYRCGSQVCVNEEFVKYNSVLLIKQKKVLAYR